MSSLIICCVCASNVFHAGVCVFQGYGWFLCRYSWDYSKWNSIYNGDLSSRGSWLIDLSQSFSPEKTSLAYSGRMTTFSMAESNKYVWRNDMDPTVTWAVWELFVILLGLDLGSFLRAAKLMLLLRTFGVAIHYYLGLHCNLHLQIQSWINCPLPLTNLVRA